MTLNIRFAAPTDNVTIEQIENAADQLLIDRLTPLSWEPAPAAGSRAADPGYILVAEETEGSSVIAFVHVLELDQTAHLEQLSVLPEHGRRGYGRALVEAAKNEARRRGYQSLSLRTYADVLGTRPSMRAPDSSRRGRRPTSTNTLPRSKSDSASTCTAGAFR